MTDLNLKFKLSSRNYEQLLRDLIQYLEENEAEKQQLIAEIASLDARVTALGG